MPVPDSNLVEQKPQGGIVSSAPRGIPVFIGCCSRGAKSPALPAPAANPTQSWGRNAQKAIAAYHGAGPLSRRAAYVVSQMGGECLTIGVPATARAASKPAAGTIVANISSTFTATLSGTPTAGAAISILFGVAGGVTGTGPIAYQVSYDGGNTYGITQALGTALTIVVFGVTCTLGSARVVTAGDTISWFQRAASQSILPQILTKANASTATYTITGTPADAYRGRVEWLTGGTLATAGITGRYCLDWDAVQQIGTWTTFALGTGLTLLPLDGVEPSGLTITAAATGTGTIDAGDVLEFGTTAPEAQVSDVVAAMAAVRASGLTWSWFVVLNPSSSTDAAAVDTLLTGASWAGGGRRAWALVETRDRETYEPIASWAASVRTDYASFTSTRVFPCAGAAPASDPITGRRPRFNAIVDYATRFATISISTDAGWLSGLGALPASRILYAPGGQQIEHDADADPQLFDAQGPYRGFLVLRTFEDSQFPGTYPAGSICMPAAGDLGLVQLRRVLDTFEDTLQSQARLELLSPFRRWTSVQVAQTAGKYKVGDVREEDARAIERRLYAAAYAALVATGNATAIIVTLVRTPVALGPPGIFGLSYKGQLSAFGTIYQMSGTAFLLANG